MANRCVLIYLRTFFEKYKYLSTNIRTDQHFKTQNCRNTCFHNVFQLICTHNTYRQVLQVGNSYSRWYLKRIFLLLSWIAIWEVHYVREKVKKGSIVRNFNFQRIRYFSSIKKTRWCCVNGMGRLFQKNI